jgi:hypothetical protein
MSSEHFWWRQFVSRSECDWWLGAPPKGWPDDADHRVTHILFHPNHKCPGFGLRELWRDWSAAKTFSFDIYSEMPGDFELIVRVNDRLHDDDYDDRFNRSIDIRPGFQTITIPIVDIQSAPRTRRMNMAQITGFYLYVVRPAKEIRVMVDNVHLE